MKGAKCGGIFWKKDSFELSEPGYGSKEKRGVRKSSGEKEKCSLDAAKRHGKWKGRSKGCEKRSTGKGSLCFASREKD